MRVIGQGSNPREEAQVAWEAAPDWIFQLRQMLPLVLIPLGNVQVQFQAITASITKLRTDTTAAIAAIKTDPTLRADINTLTKGLSALTTRMDNMSKEMDDLTAQVAANAKAIADATALISQLAQPSADTAAIVQATTDLKSQDDGLASAVAAASPKPVEPTPVSS